jgi:membrane protein DedA with SNARE-associated domain
MLRVARFILDTFGLPGAGLIFLLEGLGAPLPVEVPLWIIGMRMSTGQNSYWHMVLLMWLSSLIGNGLGYLAGFYGGRPAIVKLLQWFRVKPELFAKVEGWFQRHGLKVVVITRWTNWGFAQSMWLCGITRVPFRRFFPTTLVNDFFWAMGWAYLSRAAMLYARRGRFQFIHTSTVRAALGAVALAVVGFGIWYLVKRFRRGRPSV